MKAAVFDSGIGGLTVVKSLLARKLFNEIIYYGDTARVPYGTKDPNTIIRYSLEALEFFNNFDIDILIVACNTASAYALEELRAKAKFKVIGVIEPGVLALENCHIRKDSSILVIGTQATINSQSYQTRLAQHGYTRIHALAAPLLVQLVEEGLLAGRIVDETFRHYFGATLQPDALILGCTHYPLMQDAFKQYFSGAQLVHSGEAIVEWLQKNGMASDSTEDTNIQFFATENVNKLKEIAAKWL